MSLKDDIIDGVASSLKDHIPIAVAETLEEEVLKTDSDLGKAIITLFADFARSSGTGGIDTLAKFVDRAVTSNEPKHILELATQYNAIYMSDLTDALQSAEAEAKEDCSKICTTIGTVLGDIGEILIESAIRSITTGKIL